MNEPWFEITYKDSRGRTKTDSMRAKNPNQAKKDFVNLMKGRGFKVLKVVKEGKLTEGRKVKYKKNDWKKYNQLVKKGKTVMIQTSFGDEFVWEDGSNYGVFGSESDGREIELSHDDIDQVEIF